tara:strand:+ start:283 stop:489 length:207 start_codon:yes stop_codon:yes gene_type:complete
MGNYEDLFWEVDEKLSELGLKEEFENQLLKMKAQDKHKYKSFKDKYEYAFDKVIKSPLYCKTPKDGSI